ncbi:MAG: lysophospholipid acyltransferase family protein [Hyphomicrobiales bacterium]|nr:lysophospholipid acyltransferase family protein [Hyphomicrobiales bacterium]
MNEDEPDRTGVPVTIGDEAPRRGNFLSRGMARSALRLMGWRLQGGFPDLPKMVLIGAPHTSNMDGVVAILTLTALGLRSGTMIKHSAFKGVFGSVLRWFGAIPIDRRNAGGVVGQSISAFDKAERLLLLIAPEGTRNSAAEWKRGFWLIAAGAGVPILPAAIDYAKKTVTFGAAMSTGADYAADFSRILDFYRRYSCPRHAGRASEPICGVLGMTWRPAAAPPNA